jgi:hypothetical protein
MEWLGMVAVDNDGLFTPRDRDDEMLLVVPVHAMSVGFARRISHFFNAGWISHFLMHSLLCYGLGRSLFWMLLVEFHALVG